MHRFFLRTIVILLASTALGSNGYCQDGIGIGASGIYNFQTEGIGLGLRVQIPVRDRISVIPQVSWFPKFNAVSGYFAGVSGHYNLLMRRKFILYITANGQISVSASVNASASGSASANGNGGTASGDASASKSGSFSASGEVGGGILFGKSCFRPFIEYRHNPLWNEGVAHLGLPWFPQCSFSGGGGRSKSKGMSAGSRTPNRKRSPCPAYK